MAGKLINKLHIPKNDDIAEVEFTFLDKKHRAALDKDGKWKCQDPLANKMLNVMFNPKYKSGPAFGPFGTYQVHELVKEFHGKVIKMKKFPHDPNIVY